jgi:hypothetical protein
MEPLQDPTWVIAIVYFAVALIGALVGAVELIARYRDDPFRAIVVPSAVLYMLINLTAAIFALWTLRLFSVDWWTASGPVEQKFYEIMTAGFGSMVVLRSSLFTLRVNEGDIAVGPAMVLDVLLRATDRGVDRAMAEPRATIVDDVMADVSFDLARLALPSFCMALMQNVSPEEQQSFALQVEALAGSDMTDRVKSLNLGLALLNLVGEKVLRVAVTNLKKDITP